MGCGQLVVMEVDGEIEVDAPRETVIREMQEANVLEQVIPNCTNVEEVGTREYEAEVSEQISMVSLDMELNVSIEKFNPPDSFSVVLDGTAPGSNTDVNADMMFELSETDSSGTLIDYEMDIEVSGKLASLGFRMLKSTVNKRIDQMADNVQKQFSEQKTSA